MKSHFSSTRVYRAVAVLCVCMVVFVALVFMLQRERANITDQVDTHISEDVRVADLLKMSRLAREEAALVTAITTAFQSATDTIAVIEAVETAAEEAQVILTIRQAEKGDERGRAVLSMIADARGSWQNIYRFIAKLDAFPYERRTHRMYFTRISDASEASAWNVSVEMTVPLMRQ